MSDLYDALLAEAQANIRPDSRKAKGMGWRWKHLKPFFAHLPVASVTTTRINQYKAERRAEGAAVATVNRELAVLRRSFRYGKQCTPPLVHNVPHFGLAKENNARQGFIEDHQFDRMAEEAVKEGLWLRAFIEAAYTYGWRRGELVGKNGLRVRQVDLHGAALRLDPGTTKNGEGREVPITNPALLEMLRALGDGKGPNDHVFTREDGSPVLDFRGAWQNLCARSGTGRWVCKTEACPAPTDEGAKKCLECGCDRRYEGLIVRDFRRSAARRMQQSGTPENVIMDIGGWKTPDMFRRYAIVNNDDKRRAMEALDTARRTADEPRTSPIVELETVGGKAVIQ